MANLALKRITKKYKYNYFCRKLIEARKKMEKDDILTHIQVGDLLPSAKGRNLSCFFNINEEKIKLYFSYCLKLKQ